MGLESEVDIEVEIELSVGLDIEGSFCFLEASWRKLRGVAIVRRSNAAQAQIIR